MSSYPQYLSRITLYFSTLIVPLDLFRRRTQYYVFNLIVPCILIFFMSFIPEYRRRTLYYFFNLTVPWSPDCTYN